MNARRRPRPPAPTGGAPATIVCVDCGGTCHLLSHVPEEGFAPGDVVAYRCEDCRDRWDIVLELDEDASSGPDSG